MCIKIELSDIEKDKANELSVIINEILVEVDPAEFEDEDAGGHDRAAGLSVQIAERLVTKGISFE